MIVMPSNIATCLWQKPMGNGITDPRRNRGKKKRKIVQSSYFSDHPELDAQVSASDPPDPVAGSLIPLEGKKSFLANSIFFASEKSCADLQLFS
jgi:hypothetical protein